MSDWCEIFWQNKVGDKNWTANICQGQFQNLRLQANVSNSAITEHSINNPTTASTFSISNNITKFRLPSENGWCHLN